MPHDRVTSDLLIRAYTAGVFPMAEDRGDQDLFWLDPDSRGILPLERFHIPRSLAKKIRQEPYTVSVDRAFKSVVQSCAAPARGRESTWISERIELLYTDLFERGFAHSVEVWNDEGELVGGLYGVSIHAAFFGESMFHTMRDASKIALAHLVARLKVGGFSLLDTQFVTDHLSQFGAIEVPRAEYHVRLRDALQHEADFYRLPEDASGATVLQSISHTS